MKKALIVFLGILMSSITPLGAQVCDFKTGFPINSDQSASHLEISQFLADTRYKPTITRAFPCTANWATYCGELKYHENYTILQDHIFDAYSIGDFGEGMIGNIDIRGCVCLAAFCVQDHTLRNTFSEVHSLSQCDSIQKKAYLSRKNRVRQKNK